MGPKLEGRRTNEVADILDNQQVNRIKLELGQCTLEHDRVEVTLAASVDLHCNRACRCRSVSVDGGGYIAIDDCQTPVSGESTNGMFNQGCLPCTGRSHQVERHDTC